MWSSGRRVLQDLFIQPVRSFSLSPAQNTVVVERWWQVPLSKVGSPPRLHPRRHRIYKLVEDTKQNPTEKMELILTQTVPKIGGRGDTVLVKKSVGRNKLLPNGLAVYPSPENKQMFAEDLRILREGKLEDRIQTRTGLMTVEILKRTKLTINKMPSDEFQLTKEVVCRQFQKKLRIVVPPHALSLPFESVKDEGDYWCEVMVNGLDKVRVPISLVPYENQSCIYRRQLKAQREQLQETADISESAAEEEAAVKAVSAAAEEEAAVKAVSAAAEEEAAVKAVSAAAEEEAAVKAVSAAAEEEAAVKAVSVAAEEEAAVKAVSAAAEEDAAVKAVSAAAEEEAAVKAVSAAAEEDAAVKAVSAAAEEEAAVKAVSDAAVEAEAGKDSVNQVSEAAASAAKEETAASTQTSQDTTAPPSDSSKKD